MVKKLKRPKARSVMRCQHSGSGRRPVHFWAANESPPPRTVRQGGGTVRECPREPSGTLPELWSCTVLSRSRVRIRWNVFAATTYRVQPARSRWGGTEGWECKLCCRLSRGSRLRTFRNCACCSSRTNYHRRPKTPRTMALHNLPGQAAHE